MDYKIQELGGFGVYRFLENLFHAFQALFEVLTLGNTAAARDAIDLLHRTHRISKVGSVTIRLLQRVVAGVVI